MVINQLTSYYEVIILKQLIISETNNMTIIKGGLNFLNSLTAWSLSSWILAVYCFGMLLKIYYCW